MNDIGKRQCLVVEGGSLWSLVFSLRTDSVIIFNHLSPMVTQVNRSLISDDVGISKFLHHLDILYSIGLYTAHLSICHRGTSKELEYRYRGVGKGYCILCQPPKAHYHMCFPSLNGGINIK